MRKLIEVTQADIDTAKQNRLMPCATCPVARALTRAFKQDAYVFKTTWMLLSEDISNEKTLSRSATRFIHNFDFDRPVKPFKFYV